MVKPLEQGSKQKNDINAFLERLLVADNQVQLLSEMLSETNISAENISDFEKIANLLEIYEAEIRRLRQNINLNIREYILTTYAEDLRNKNSKK